MSEMPRVLLSADRIADRVAELGRAIRATYGDDPILCLGILKGSMVFLADLLRAIDGHVQVAVLGVASYAGTESTGEVRITHDVNVSLRGLHVLVLEQQAPDLLGARDRGAAVGAALEVDGDDRRGFRRQRGGGVAEHGGGVEMVARGHACPPTSPCRRRNARRRCDLTVPSGIPSSDAISWWVLASKYDMRISRACTGGKASTRRCSCTCSA